MDNANSDEYLQKIKVQVIENLKRITFAPSVQMTDVPRDPEGMDDEADALLDDLDEDENPDQRNTKRRWDKYVEKEGELSESEDEDENDRNGVRRQPNARKRRNIMDYQNPNAVPDDEESPRCGRSRNGDRTDESHAVNDQVHENGNGNVSPRSSIANPDESGASDEASPEGSIAPDGCNVEEDDVDMADDADVPGTATTIAQASADGPQEATPPDSPPAIAAAPVVPAQVVDQVSNDAMDQDDTVEEPETTKEEGRKERELDDINAEESTEVAASA